jgi:hypothetical protein
MRSGSVSHPGAGNGPHRAVFISRSTSVPVRYSQPRSVPLAGRCGPLPTRTAEFSDSECGIDAPAAAAKHSRPTCEAPGVQLSEKRCVAPRGAVLQKLRNFPSDADDCPNKGFSGQLQRQYGAVGG